jgi:peroxiredoxin
MPMQTTLSMLRGTMQRAKDKEKMQELSDRAAQKKIEADNWAKQFIKDHPGSPALLGPLEHLEPRSNAELFARVLETTEDQLGEGTFHKALRAATAVKPPQRSNDRVVRQGNGANPPRPAKNSRYGVGDQAPDIAMTDPDGNVRKLSDLRGKVVLIDFWASWCGPCRRENPNVVRAYEQFKSRGFEVFSVSLDQNADRWKAAIAQDGLIWPNHVCDLQGWQNAASRAYGVSSIPHALLVDQEGTIVATHLRGAALTAQLNQLLR